MKHLKKFNESESYDVDIKSAYDKIISQNVTNDEDKLRQLILDELKKQHSLGLSYAMRSGMSDFLEQGLIFRINRFFRQMKKKR